jgi:integrase
MNTCKVIDIQNKLNPVDMFLNRKSGSTKDTYERYIKMFFNFESITIETIANVTHLDAEQYEYDLRQSGLSSATINAYIQPLKYLYDYLLQIPQYKNVLINLNPFVNIKISVQNKSVEGFSKEEVFKLIDVALPKTKVLYEMAVRTGIRKSALLNLNVNNNFIQIDGYCVVMIEDKRNKQHRKAIPEALWRQCFDIANKDGVVFDMSEKTVNNHLAKDMKLIGLSDQEIKTRSLVFHSLRKSSAIISMDETNGDLNKVSKHMLHSNVNTTNNIYLNSKKDYSTDLSLSILNKEDVKTSVWNKMLDLDKREIMDKLMELDDATLRKVLNVIK